MQQTYALSFKDLKQRITIEQVLRHYNLFETLELKGKSHRGPCPFCEAQDGSPFSVSLEKSCYQCFSCKASGNILEFVMQWEGVKVREAGEILAHHFVHAKDAHEKPRATPKPAEEKSLPAEEAPPPVPLQPAGGAGERPDPTPSTKTPTVDTTEGETPCRNEPLSFGLKNIESDHPCVKALGIHEDTITSFGVGYYCGRGMMGNHIVIPIFNPNRERIAYAGVHPTEGTSIYPPKFRRELELYPYFRNSS
jgi:CHC2 zinc finger